MKQKKLFKILAILILLISLILLTISFIKILTWFNDSKNIKTLEKEIDQVTEIEEVSDNEDTIIIEQEEEIPESNPYWDYIKMNLINVDFAELKKINPEVVGWIQLNGTNVNYPFVQTNDNEFYLNHSIDKSTNSAGWVFMDYRNKLKEFDKNTILYAHGRGDNTMFGSLKNVIKTNWLQKTANHIIKLSTETENTLWQVFSVYYIPTTNDYIQTTFINDEEYEIWLNTIKTRSIYSFDTTVSASDKVLTLSTCKNKDEKIVLHAKLIKKELR